MFKKGKREIDNMRLIQSVSTETEAVVIAGLLDSCGIYSRLEYDTDAGAPLKVVIGTSNLGVNIYVMQEDYDEAVDILEAEKTEEE